MTQAEKLEKRINKIKGYENKWIFRKGNIYYMQDISTGNIEKELGNYESAETYIILLEELEKNKTF